MVLIRPQTLQQVGLGGTQLPRSHPPSYILFLNAEIQLGEPSFFLNLLVENIRSKTIIEFSNCLSRRIRAGGGGGHAVRSVPGDSSALHTFQTTYFLTFHLPISYFQPAYLPTLLPSNLHTIPTVFDTYLPCYLHPFRP